jgi:hypothetical protein
LKKPPAIARKKGAHSFSKPNAEVVNAVSPRAANNGQKKPLVVKATFINQMKAKPSKRVQSG